MITKRDNALFEAGIKLGALYHQFVGAPVNHDTADSLEQAIERCGTKAGNRGWDAAQSAIEMANLSKESFN